MHGHPAHPSGDWDARVTLMFPTPGCVAGMPWRQKTPAPPAVLTSAVVDEDRAQHPGGPCAFSCRKAHIASRGHGRSVRAPPPSTPYTMSYLESDALTSTSPAHVQALTSTARRRGTSLIAPPSTHAKPEPPAGRSLLSKGPAHMHRRTRSLNLPTCGRYPAPSPASNPSPIPARVARSRPRVMLSKINTSSIGSPDRPSRRPHGPRSAYSPSGGSAKSATRAHYHDAWKVKAGPSTIRTSPPQTSLPSCVAIFLINEVI
ncbi:hypothetical protein C8T65DRAFT_76643 [Cerioporus squamosus]|nr:hypothetical protein C8T65DRAFT_76643 [Cerioporus squamosus]